MRRRPGADCGRSGTGTSGTSRTGRTAMALDSTPATTHVTTPSGRVIPVPGGSRLVFGRGPDADLVIPADRGLSRRPGTISAAASGAWVANISCTHALYAEGDGYRIRLPRLDEASAPDEPSCGWFGRHGAALGGSRRPAGRGPAAAPGRHRRHCRAGRR